MSLAYNAYITSHKEFVLAAYMWILSQLDEQFLKTVLPNYVSWDTDVNIQAHDNSKYNPNEYEAYDEYFYNGGYATEEGKKNFDLAFLHHIHKNPHHWQYWVLIKDDGSTDTIDGHKVIAQDMEDNYILEMICDWWSFSWKKFYTNGVKPENKSDMYEVFDWYDSHKDSMILSENTRRKVETLLAAIRERLEFASLDQIKYALG